MDEVQEQRVAGVGRLFHLPLTDGWEVSVFDDQRGGGRELSVLCPGEDEPRVRLHLSDSQAVILAGLLGAADLLEGWPHTQGGGRVQVETVVIGAGSPAAGRTLGELEIPSPDEARVLAVIRDDTPDLIEEDPDRPCAAGDRLVVAGRPGELGRLMAHLSG